MPARAAKRSPTSFCTIATQVVTCGRSETVRRITRGGDAVGQVRDDLGRARDRARRGRAGRRRRGAAWCSGADRARRAGRARACGRARRRGRARRARRGARTARPSPPPTSSTTSAGSSVRGARDHVEQVRVDQEVLAQVAPRADAERLHPPQARLDGELAHQPNRRALLACTAASSSLVADPAALGDERARCGRRRPAGCAPCARPGASGTARRSPRGCGRAAPARRRRPARAPSGR